MKRFKAQGASIDLMDLFNIFSISNKLLTRNVCNQPKTCWHLPTSSFKTPTTKILNQATIKN